MHEPAMFWHARAMTPGRILPAVVVVVGIDLFFNAGLFAPLFDQDREPALLTDAVLFRRIPFAYAALAVAVVLLAWVLDRTGRTGSAAVATGAIGGLGTGVAGLGALWTAIDLTGAFVIAGIAVLTIQGGTAAAVLTSRTPTRRLVLWMTGTTITLFVFGQLIANLRTG